MHCLKCDNCGDSVYKEGDILAAECQKCGGIMRPLKTKTEPASEVPCSDRVITLPGSIDDIEDVELFKSFNNCRKKPIITQATQMNEDFRVETLEGNYKQGRAGGYLMCGIDGELYICDESIFKRTYDWL